MVRPRPRRHDHGDGLPDPGSRGRVGGDEAAGAQSSSTARTSATTPSSTAATIRRASSSNTCATRSCHLLSGGSPSSTRPRSGHHLLSAAAGQPGRRPGLHPRRDHAKRGVGGSTLERSAPTPASATSRSSAAVFEEGFAHRAVAPARTRSSSSASSSTAWWRAKKELPGRCCRPAAPPSATRPWLYDHEEPRRQTKWKNVQNSLPG